VFTGNVRLEDYKDRIVIIGASATGVGDRLATPVSASMAPVQALAHTVSSILQGHFFTRPAWAPVAELGVALLLVLYLCLGIPRLSPTVAAGATLALLIPTTRSGLLDLIVYGLDANQTPVARGNGQTTIAVGDRVDVTITLTACAAPCS